MSTHRVTHRSISILRSLALALGASAILAQALAAPALAQGRDADGSHLVDTRRDAYIVVFEDHVRDPRGQAAAMARQHGLAPTHTYTAAIRGFAARLSPQARNALLNNPNVARIEPDPIAYGVSAQTTPRGINQTGARSAHSSGQTGRGVRVAVIDTGVDLDHADLAANIDRSLSRTFVSWTAAPSGGDDDQGHGTHVAGTVGAIDDGGDVVGMAPESTLISLKVLTSTGSGSLSDIIAAIDYVTWHNMQQTSYADCIHVVNMSLGGPGNDGASSFHSAVNRLRRSGCAIAVAAGNESQDTANTAPGSYDEVLSVSALDTRYSTYRLASFSNFGHDVDVAAPGVYVLSTRLGGGTVSFSGTSMASPHVAGGLALYIGANMGSIGAGWSPWSGSSRDAGNFALVGSIHQAIVASGRCADGAHHTSCSSAWSGDSDGYNEPLLDANQALLDAAPAPAPEPEPAPAPEPAPTPALSVTVQTDKSSYDSSIDASVGLRVSVRDENGAAVSGLPSSAFDTQLDGAAMNPAFSETAAGSGDYTASLPLPTAGNHAVTVTATDERSASDSGSDSFSVVDAAALAVTHVAGIGYRGTGKGGRDLNIDVAIADAAGNAVSDARVDVTIFRNGAVFGTGTLGTTSGGGTVSYKIRNAASGTYVTRVDAVVKDGTQYDPSANVADPGFEQR